MKYKHYAPKKKCILIYNENEEQMIELINKYKTKKSIFIGNKKYSKLFKKHLISGESLDEVSHNIFSLIRKADTIEGDLIIIQGVKKKV
jgi:hypothetical protein